MLKRLARAGVVVGALGASAAVQPATVTYDFTGSGEVCHYTHDDHTCTSNVEFSGEITLEVDQAVGPSHSDGSTYARRSSFWKDSPHWVTPAVAIRWSESSFTSEVIPTGSGTDTTYQAEVRNDYPEYQEDTGAFAGNVDQLRAYSKAERIVESRLYYWNKVEFDRRSTDTSWLRDLAFDTAKALPAEGRSILEFDTQSDQLNASGSWEMNGVTGRVDILTLSIRKPMTSAEPTTLELGGNDAVSSGNLDDTNIDAGPGTALTIAQVGSGGGSLDVLLLTALAGTLLLGRRTPHRRRIEHGELDSELI